MIRFFLFIKYKLPLVWLLIEQVNGLFFHLKYGFKLKNQLKIFCENYSIDNIIYKFIENNHLVALNILLTELELSQKKYFEAHSYTLHGLSLQLSNRSLIMLGCFNNDELIGYFFLRCFFNKKCFIGRLVHKDFRSKGIGRTMNTIMYRAAWQSGFRVYATLSAENQLVMQSHRNNPYMHILKELPDNYMLVEFRKPDNLM